MSKRIICLACKHESDDWKAHVEHMRTSEHADKGEIYTSRSSVSQP